VTLLIAPVTLMGLSLFTAGLELIGTGTSIQRMLLTFSQSRVTKLWHMYLLHALVGLFEVMISKWLR